MGLLAWIGIGLCVATVVLTMIRGGGSAFWGYIILGVVGAVSGGTAGNVLGWRGVEDVNPANLGTALITSVVFLVVFHGYRKYRLRNPPAGTIEPRYETY
jgi:uncharacterized membrane protein YeaQ/YmgE (transglycosylase-associated protein family)